MDREVPLVKGVCDVCQEPTWVYDFYGDYICEVCYIAAEDGVIDE